MQKIQLSEDQQSMLCSYNDFLEALAENGMNPFAISQEKRIEMFVGAVSMYKQHVAEMPKEIETPLEYKMPKAIGDVFMAKGMIKQVLGCVTEAMNFKGSREEAREFIELLETAEKPSHLVFLIAANYKGTKEDAMMFSEIIATLMVEGN